MATLALKCKMCGGELVFEPGSSVAVCEYCGTKQTVSSANDEKRINLFNRANRLRINSEFDRAATIYEQIIAEFPDDAEAYWGLCLCNYGIEYIDDPATARKIPTCHRASFDSLLKDENYELALKHADMYARILYKQEAEEIDRIMGEILFISKSEKPYDVFICYKETDSDGNRTEDSVIAQDIYDALTEKGYKVFFSRITLEDKLGRQYEPYIFAALNSAKVMLAIGTDYENFSSVWVKNEWSRFLRLMAKDGSKVLIPCYKDMDPYEMPDEFKGLQAQDLGKLGYMQDLVRGIDKLLGRTQQITSVHGIQEKQSVEDILARADELLKAGEWDRAKSFFDRVLQVDIANEDAYLGILLADLKTKTIEQLSLQKKPFDGIYNYDQLFKVANDQTKVQLTKINKEIRKRRNTRRIVFLLPVLTICSVITVLIIFKTIIIPMKTKKDYQESINTLKEQYRDISVGECIGFGSYEQDGNEENGEEEIEWVVLEKDENKMLIISKYALDSKPYHKANNRITWETCFLRSWLNEDFYNEAFNETEKELIIEETVLADGNPDYKTNPGNDTMDRIFLLSITEANEYFNADVDRICSAVDTVKNENNDNGNCRWWLRSPGNSTGSNLLTQKNNEAIVTIDGSVLSSGNTVTDRNGVRPVMWISVSP